MCDLFLPQLQCAFQPLRLVTLEVAGCVLVTRHLGALMVVVAINKLVSPANECFHLEWFVTVVASEQFQPLPSLAVVLNTCQNRLSCHRVTPSS